MIAELVNIETQKSIRKAHIKEMQKYTMRHIPEGKYKLNITYGKGYKEETINDNCIGYFSREISTEKNEDIIDFNIKKTESGETDIPSYALIIDQSTPTERLEEGDYIKPIDESNFNCLNTDAFYNKNLDNYLELATATGTEVILKLVLAESEKIMRTVHLSEKSKTYMRNVPEGKYQLHIDYGTEYIEKNINGKCTASFKNLINTEKRENLIDFTIVTDEKGRDIPSYSLMIDSKS